MIEGEGKNHVYLYAQQNMTLVFLEVMESQKTKNKYYAITFIIGIKIFETRVKKKQKNYDIKSIIANWQEKNLQKNYTSSFLHHFLLNRRA